MSREAHAGTATVAERAAMAVYVYGVTGRGAAPLSGDIAGVSGRHASVRAIEGGEFAALVSDVPAQWHAASRQDAVTHDRVLSELMRDRTIVPMRFGIVLASDAAVRERLLQRHAAELSMLADRLEGCEQMAVKAYYEDEALLRAVLARRPELKRRAEELEGRPVTRTQGERIALGQEVSAEVEQQRALDERALVEPLSALGEQVQVDAGASDRHLTTIQLLVRRDRRAELDAAVRRLADEHSQRIVLRYVGPLPPYSFSAFALEAEPNPWG